ncbi:MAG TPA: HEAT repeat domain-containing protein [Labilithrix sp.]|nr:HEAT repeat domain-containing protein [Labilithrix sp.]
MGLFDLFKGKSGGGGKNGDGGDKRKPNAAAKWAEAAGSKRAQAYDRQEAIQELCKLKSADAVEALLKRFTFATDPSITDQEEKDATFEGIVAAGREAIEPVRTFAAKAESIAQPLRIMKEILGEDELVDELLVWLKRWDTEYAKFIDPKLQILQALEEYEHEDIREAVEPFLQDVNEPARFHAVAATLAQKEPEAVAPLIAALLEEESVRVRAKIADGFVAMGWEVPDETRDAVRKVLPPQYTVDGAGQMTKRG